MTGRHRYEIIMKVLPIGNILIALHHGIYFYDMSQGAAPVVQNQVASIIALAGIIITLVLAISSAICVQATLHAGARLAMLAALGGLFLLDALFWIQEMDWALYSVNLSFPHNVLGRVAVGLIAISWVTLNLFVILRRDAKLPFFN